MALVKATCSDCGDVNLLSRDITIRTCEDTDETQFLFRCPACWMIEARPAGPYVVDVLRAIGCAVETWQLPLELGDPQRTSQRPITHDDVLDFHISLSEASDERIIAGVLPVTTDDQQRFLNDLQEADSSVIARELRT